jgi:hypothetical protein
MLQRAEADDRSTRPTDATPPALRELIVTHLAPTRRTRAGESEQSFARFTHLQVAQRRKPRRKTALYFRVSRATGRDLRAAPENGVGQQEKQRTPCLSGEFDDFLTADRNLSLFRGQ